jgi:hypothetical protein
MGTQFTHGKIMKFGNGVPTPKKVWELRSQPFPNKLIPDFGAVIVVQLKVYLYVCK